MLVQDVFHHDALYCVPSFFKKGSVRWHFVDFCRAVNSLIAPLLYKEPVVMKKRKLCCSSISSLAGMCCNFINLGWQKLNHISCLFIFVS